MLGTVDDDEDAKAAAMAKGGERGRLGWPTPPTTPPDLGDENVGDTIFLPSLIFQWGASLGDASLPMRCICVAWALYTLGVDVGDA